MKAIIWKELRENFRWAVLGMVVVGLAMAFAVHEGARRGESIVGDAFLVMTTFLGPALGAAIGFLQVIFESRQGHWALLVHRPISRRRIFLGKVIAGLTLYFGVMLIPFLLSALWAQIPGNVGGPFRWGMAVPGLIDILTGTVYYFAGMVTARRAARWYASRCLVLVAAILCSILVFVAVYQAWAALLIIAVAASLMFAAAYGSFITGGEYKPQHWLAKTPLGIILLVGIVLTGAAAFGFISSFIPEPDYRSYMLRYVSHRLLRDGRVVAVERIGGVRVAVSDLDGNPLPELFEQTDEVDPLVALSPPQAEISLNPMEPYRIWPWYRHWYRTMYTYLREDPTARWYYLPDTGRIEGYDYQTRRRIGSIGPSGFAMVDEDPTDRFTGDRIPSRKAGTIANLFPMTSGIYVIDLSRRTVELLFTPETGTRIESLGGIWKIGSYDRSMMGMGAGYSPEVEHEGYAIVTGNRILLLDPDARVLARHTPDFQPPAYPHVSISKLDDPGTYAFWYSPSWGHFGPDALDMPRSLVIYGPDGQLVSSIEVPADEYEQRPLPISRGFWGLVIPPGPYVASQVVQQIKHPQIRHLQAHARHSEITMFVCLLLAGIVSLVINLRLARRNAMGRGRRILWATLGLLLGLSGILLMLCLQAWPARLRCDGCGVARLVSRFNCEHCGVAIAPLARDGTEIFD